jgi:hypothetical protein
LDETGGEDSSNDSAARRGAPESGGVSPSACRRRRTSGAPRQAPSGSGEGGALVRADDEDRVAEAAAAHGIDGKRVRVEHDLVREPVEGKLGQPEARLRLRDHVAVARRGRDEDKQAVDRQLRARGLRKRDVADLRRVEDAAEKPRYWNSSTSPSTWPRTPRAWGRAPGT